MLSQVLKNVRIVLLCSIAVAFELISSLHAEFGVFSFCKLVSIKICQVADTFYLRSCKMNCEHFRFTVSQSGHNYFMVYPYFIFPYDFLF